MNKMHSDQGFQQRLYTFCLNIPEILLNCLCLMGILLCLLIIVLGIIAVILLFVAMLPLIIFAIATIIAGIMIDSDSKITEMVTNGTYPCTVNVIYGNAFLCTRLSITFEIFTWIIISIVAIVIIGGLIFLFVWLICWCVFKCVDEKDTGWKKIIDWIFRKNASNGQSSIIRPTELQPTNTHSSSSSLSTVSPSRNLLSK